MQCANLIDSRSINNLHKMWRGIKPDYVKIALYFVIQCR